MRRRKSSLVSPADALRSCGTSGKPFVCTAWRSISSMCCPSWGRCSIRTSEGTVDRFRLSKAESKSCMSGGDQPSGCRGDCEFSVGVPSSPAGARQHQAPLMRPRLPHGQMPPCMPITQVEPRPAAFHQNGGTWHCSARGRRCDLAMPIAIALRLCTSCNGGHAYRGLQEGVGSSIASPMPL